MSDQEGALEEPPDDAPVYTETDPSGRYGRFDTVLGRGAFKTVYKAFDTEEGTEVAWNQVKVGELVGCNSKEERDRLYAEIRVLKQLKHKNIMTFYDSWLDPKTMSINFITELFTSGTLRQYRKRHRHIDEEVLKRWAWQILCGLVYLHGHTPPIIHRDLKCDNIFINGSDGTVKIGDLGLATMLRSRTAPQSVTGTPEFMAPELYEEEYDDRVDVYSFGMCMLELATMEYPYAECKNAAQIYRKVSLGVRPAGLQRVTNQELADFINLCISPGDQRPRSRMLLKHPYFDSIRPPGQLASKSQVGLSSIGNQPDGLLDYGSGGASMGLSRSSSANAEGDMASSAAAVVRPAAAAAAAAPAAPRPVPAAGTAGSAPPVAPVQASALRNATDAGAEACGGIAAASQQHVAEAAPAQPSTVARAATAPSKPLVAAPPGEPSGTAAAEEEEEEEQGSGAQPQPQPQPAQEPAAQPQQQPLLHPQAPPSQPQQLSNGASESESEDKGYCECTPGQRTFMVVGKYAEDNNTFSLRLRICDPDGAVRTVEFEFDIERDTAISVASEMVEDLQLSQEDAAAIAAAIRNEIASLTSHLEEQVSLSLEQASMALQEGLQNAALLNASPRTGHSYMEQAAALAGQRSAAGAAAPAAAAGGKGGGERPWPSTTGPAAPAIVVAAPAAVPAAARAPGPRASSPVEEPSLGAAPPRQPGGEAPQERSGGAHTPADPTSAAASGQERPPSMLVRANSSSISSLQSLASAQSGESAVTALSQLSGTTRASAVSTASASAAGAPGAGLGPGLPRPTSPPMEFGSLGGLGMLPTGVLPPGRDARLLRSHSATSSSSLLSRSGISAKEPAVASPSGALSPPSSGVLSPTLPQDKRIPLNKLFDNLHGLAALHSGAGSNINGVAERPAAPDGATAAGALPHAGLPARAPSASAAPLLARAYSSGHSSFLGDGLPSPRSSYGEARLPLFPTQQQQHGRHLSGSLSGSALADGGTLIPQEAFMPRPASEACLAALLERFDPFNLSSAEQLAAAGASYTPGAPSALAGSTSEPPAHCPSSPAPRQVPSATLGVLGPGALAPQQAQVAGGVLLHQQHLDSASSSKAASRDASPVRSAAMSPTRASLVHDPAFIYDGAAGQGKKGKTDADKEALRKQAADAMKAVELRSLNLLEGGMLAGKMVRGTPMAATRLPSGLGCSAPAAGGAAAAAPAAAPAGAAAVPVAAAVGREPSFQEGRGVP